MLIPNSFYLCALTGLAAVWISNGANELGSNERRSQVRCYIDAVCNFHLVLKCIYYYFLCNVFRHTSISACNTLCWDSQNSTSIMHKKEPLQNKQWVTFEPFPSCVLPLFQNESRCSTFHMELSLICKTMNVKEKLISIWKVVHQDSFWNRGKGNSEIPYFLCLCPLGLAAKLNFNYIEKSVASRAAMSSPSAYCVPALFTTAGKGPSKCVKVSLLCVISGDILWKRKASLWSRVWCLMNMTWSREPLLNACVTWCYARRWECC